MFFSLISPDAGREREALHQRLGGPYADHQWLWRWFAAPAGTARDFIFRQHEPGNGSAYYVVSTRPPAERQGDWSARTREYAPQVAAGEVLRFELRANPTVRHGRDQKSKRHDVVMEAKKALLAARGQTTWSEWIGPDKPAPQGVIHEACAKWLGRCGASRGFDVDAESLIVESYQQHREKPGQKLRFSSVDLSGELTVTDPERFALALCQGVGTAKAFGCGLLLIRRPG